MRKFLFIIIFIFIFILHSAHALSEDVYPFPSSKDQSRFLSLTKEIRCMVCQNQSIADSNAPLALDLRNKIYQFIIEKKSNEEIKDYLVKRYGQFILMHTPFNKQTLLLWLCPFLGLIFLFILIKKNPLS